MYCWEASWKINESNCWTEEITVVAPDDPREALSLAWRHRPTRDKTTMNILVSFTRGSQVKSIWTAPMPLERPPRQMTIDEEAQLEVERLVPTFT